MGAAAKGKAAREARERGFAAARRLGALAIRLPGARPLAAGLALTVAVALTLAFAPVSSRGQETETRAFTEESLSYRTSLHRDPLDPEPLRRLVKLYEESDRLDELIGLYRAHIEQYPEDAGAKTVLVRILKQAGRPGEGELLASAVPQHPESASLQYLLYLFLDERGEPRAVDSLSTAIELASDAAKRDEWLEELLKLGDDERARALGQGHLERLLSEEGQPGTHWLALARMMERFRFWDLVLRAVAKAGAAGLAGEESVEAEILAARAEHERGRSDLAGARLDQLLSRLAPDYWRRREILSLRLGVVAGGEEREAVLDSLREAYESASGSEAAALDYAEALLASERRDEAARVLVASSGALPASLAIEARAMELLESINDPAAFEAFLSERLEIDPERADLRFRLVKAYFSLRRDAEAEQEFRVVRAGLERHEVTARLLELQRYLAGIERPAAATRLLEDEVRNHLSSLVVARELAGVYAAAGRAEEIPPLVARLEPAGSDPAEVLELARFLIAREQAAAARELIQSKLASMESPDFPLSLLLLETLGIVGDATGTEELVRRLRDRIDSPDRYRRWLEASAAAHRRLETLDRFFEEEERRYSFGDGEWNPLKLEQFLVLCELARDRLPRDRVLSAVRSQLAAPGLEAALRIRLRRFLVGLLADDPAAFDEVDEQLQQLVSEDAGNRQDYDLQRALVSHRAQRSDLAKPLFVGVDFGRVASASLAADAVEILVELGFLNEAASALAAVNRLSPEDVFSWERRLTLLALLGDETAFRSVLRHWRSDEAPVPLGAESLAGLDRHLLASYWRSVSRRIASGEARQFEEVLPLLATVDRESAGGRAGAWSEWSRAIVLVTLGREAEAAEARDRLVALLAVGGNDRIAFPDGLTLSLSGARLFLDRAPVALREKTGSEAEFLLPSPELRWAFELDPGNRIEQVARTAEHLLVMDRHRQVHAIDPGSGKLLWKRSFADGAGAATPPPPLWPGFPPAAAGVSATGVEQVKLADRLATLEDRFFILREGRIEARRPEDAALLWAEPLPFEAADPVESNRGGASPGVLLKVEGDHAVVFRPLSGDAAGFDSRGGKLLWHRQIGVPQPDQGPRGMSASGGALPGGGTYPAADDSLHSLNSGIDIDGGLVLLYGWETAVLDAATGETLWDFTGGGGVTFPVVLRRDRGEREGIDPAALGRALSPGPSAPSRFGGTLARSESVVPGAETDGVASADGGDSDPGQSGDHSAAGAQPQASAASESRIDLIDYLKGPPRRGTRPPLFREGRGESAAMLSSGAYWARARLRSGGAALGVVDGGYLWLMQDNRVRRISIRFPVAARELPARGTYLGRSGQHLWFLEGSTLHHLDFLYERVSTVDVSAVGGARVRAVLSGNQILVAGDAGVRVVNAITGRVVGSGAWPDSFSDYLASGGLGVEDGAGSSASLSLWQGQVFPSAASGPHHCVPFAESLRSGDYVGRFGERVLAAFGEVNREP